MSEFNADVNDEYKDDLMIKEGERTVGTIPGVCERGHKDTA